ncbi:MAG: AAA family ATPase [Acidimicrobiales bacterium]
MTSNGNPGLAWPDHDTGPTPPPEYKGRPRDDDRLTRKPLSPWDRTKFLVLLVAVFGVMLWATMIDNPIIPFQDALRDTVNSKWWILALIGLELARQIHYFISEHSAGYNQFWTKKVFGGYEKRTGRMNDWNRYRMGRALSYVVMIALLGVVLGAATDQSAIGALLELPSTIWSAMPMIIQVVFIMLIAVGQFVAIFWFLSKGGMEIYYPDDIKTRFSDVWGQDNVVERVKENMLFLENPESVEDKGGYVPGGILLWGPPGTGKTLMAEAVAGETGKPYMFVDPGAFTNMFMGVGILKVKSLFRKLRKLAVRYGGVIVFFDEADSLGSRGQVSQQGALGATRPGSPWAATATCNGLTYASETTLDFLSRSALSSGTDEPARGRMARFVMGAGMGGGGMGTLQALLAELSGLKKPRGFMNRVVRRTLGMRPKPPPKYRILVMMATNMPEALDEALLRPGRIDRIYKVGYPSKEGRMRTYQGYLDKVKNVLTPAEIEKLATITPYATGATIKDLVNEALIVAIRDGRDTITWKDIIQAKHMKTLGPPQDGDYIVRERHAVAVHEACHAVVAYRVRRHLQIDIATIERRGAVGGFVSGIPPEDRFVNWRSEYDADIMTFLASLAGERLFFDGDNSAGVSGDLTNSTEIATLMEGYLGMGSTVAVHGVTHKVGIGGGPGKGGDKSKPGDIVDEKVLGGLGQRIEERLEELLIRTEQLLRENRAEVLAVAHALETHKTVTGDDIEAIIEGRRGPLIDGRWYHTPDFRSAAEAYHELALVAHKSHGVIDVPLPAVEPEYVPASVSEPISFETPPNGSSDDRSPWSRPASNGDD